MNTKNTLSAIIARSSQRDRENEALKRYENTNSQRRAWRLPKTLHDLRRSLGSFGQVAVEQATFQAVGIWLMREPDAKLSNPLGVVVESVGLRREELLAVSGLPNHNDGPRPNRMAMLSLVCQSEARRVAAVTVKDWEQAERPYLKPANITATYQYFVSCQKPVDALELAA